MGEGLGKFAATTISSNMSLQQAWRDPAIVRKAQQQLLRQGAYLPGRLLEDYNLAEEASITASSEQNMGQALLTVDQHTRTIHGKGGVRPELTEPGMHRWMSEPGDSSPWLELSWKQPITLQRITLILDSGLHRPLMLTHEDRSHRKVIWGPQPEVLKSFILSVKRDEQPNWTSVANVQDNYSRQLVFKVQLEQISKLRLDVIETNGLDHARVVQIRCM
ncbi:hypothetical protein GCM10010911_41490 [Paenibacillus nasutitermitis]|uniref:Uncharacterized protein n=2 Tax=Paenibacillus nasutitermitis TaxID=1652958 RepID=A0A917DYB3_9BACL|nr:hypothetical protein GCM10010911_41490 [Paenibacillus nasutitermitis]